MKTRFTLAIIILLIFLTAGATVVWWYAQPQPVNNEELANFQPMTCLYSTTITSSTAVPNWTTETVLQARSIDKSNFTPYEPLEDLNIDGQSIAWVNKKGMVVVDNEIFSDLRFVDVSGFTGDLVPMVVGQMTETDLKDEEWRTVLEFLLNSHVIKTYAHLESELCLDQEENTESAYVAHFKAVHRYCTSDCYEVPYEFTLQVNKQTKEISVL